MRRKARLDDNHNEVVKALRKMGCSVQSLASIGNGVPDILVARCGKMALAEIKDGAKVPSKRRLTEDEINWHANWKAPVWVIQSVQEAIWMVENM